MLVSIFIYSFIMIFIFAFLIEGDDFQLAAYIMLLTTIIVLFIIISQKPWESLIKDKEQVFLLNSDILG